MTTRTIAKSKLLGRVVHGRATIANLAGMATGAIETNGNAGVTECTVVSPEVRIQVVHLRTTAARLVSVTSHTVK